MAKLLTSLLAAGALILPLPAYADCAERIVAVENHPAVAESPEPSIDVSEATDVSEAPAPGSAEEVVEEEMVDNGEAVQESGGETVYADGGPAEPRESWFTSDSEELGTVLTHLDAAREARSSGDEAACIEQVQQAEKLLRDNAG